LGNLLIWTTHSQTSIKYHWRTWHRALDNCLW